MPENASGGSSSSSSLLIRSKNPRRCQAENPLKLLSEFAGPALALPGVIEGAHHGHADFRVGKRLFETLGYPDEKWGMVKLTPDQQAVLIDAEPGMFRPVPGAWGRSGSTNVKLAKIDQVTLRSALEMAWRNVAPKSLLASLETR
ncbi:MmcQ/YjbR family DNA-binding protein [Bradyrhizobium barranii]|uniref:MmcQ/YjbR family DNA-binding protein n=1 Tax=Bradyrhizobium barranii TaxID=2992140 RepID=UPI0038BA8DC1